MQIENCAFQIMVVADIDRNPTRTQGQQCLYAQNASSTMPRLQKE